MERELGYLKRIPSLSDVIWERQMELDGSAIMHEAFLDRFLDNDNTLPTCIAKVDRWLTAYGPEVIRITASGSRLEYRLHALRDALPKDENLCSVERALKHHGFKVLCATHKSESNAWKVWTIPDDRRRPRRKKQKREDSDSDFIP